MTASRVLLLTLCGLWIALCLWLTGPVDKVLPGPRLGWYFASFGGYFAAVGIICLFLRRPAGRRLIALVFLLAAALRIIAFVRVPVRSDDVYRYVWDGRMQHLGINPYLYPPHDLKLKRYRDRNWEGINHKATTTIYPPFAQMCFAGLYRLWPDSPIPFRLFFTLLDLASALVLLLILRQLGRPESLFLLYAWNPLPVSEFASSGHVDSLGIFLLLVTILVWLKGKRAASGALLGLSAMSKGFSLLALPFFCRKDCLRFLGGLVSAVVLCVLPYMSAGGALFGGLLDYTKWWKENSSLFPLLKAGLQMFLAPAQADLYSRFILAALFVFVFLWLIKKAGNEQGAVLRGITYAFGLFLLLSPTVFPWYVCWLAALVCIAFSPGLWVWTATVGLHYVRMASDQPQSVFWLWVEYLPVYALLAAELFRRQVPKHDRTVILSVSEESGNAHSF